MYMHSSKKRNRNDFQSSINEGSHLKDTVRTDISYKVNKKRKKKINDNANKKRKLMPDDDDSGSIRVSRYSIPPIIEPLKDYPAVYKFDVEELP
eukprot:UN04482